VSGGLDSLVSFLSALRKTRVVLALTFDYGQTAAKREIQSARQICRRYGIKHRVVKLFLPASGICRKKNSLKQDVKSVWVCNRNGVFVAMAAAFAESMEAAIIVTGFNAEEAREFPDNSKKFVRSANLLLKYSVLTPVRLVSYTQELDKAGIIRLGERLKAPWDILYSCYAGRKKMCGRCLSCRHLTAALKKTGLWKKIKRKFEYAD